MELFYIILLIIAAVCFVVAAMWNGGYRGDVGPGPYYTRVNFVGLGLLFWVLVPLIQSIKAY